MAETIFCATLCAVGGCIFGEKILDVFTKKSKLLTKILARIGLFAFGFVFWCVFNGG